MILIKYKTGNLALISNTVFNQSWFEKENIVEIMDLGYYESFFALNLKTIYDLLKDGKLKTKAKWNVNKQIYEGKNEMPKM